MKKLFLGVVILFLISAGCSVTKTIINNPSPAPLKDYKNTSYNIDSQIITLTNGIAEVDDSSSPTTKTTYKYFGNEVTGDFNNDSNSDTAFLLTKDSGGSGTFYYLVVALSSSKNAQGLNGVLLGDRIAPQTTEYKNGEIAVNFAERKPGETMTTPPSVGVSRYFTVTDNKMVEVLAH